MLKFIAFAVLLAVHVAQAQIPAGGIPLTQGDFLHSARAPSGTSRARSQVVEVEHASFTQALRIEVLHEAGDPWSVEIGNPTALAVQKGDVALIHFWARGIESSDETGEVYATVYAQKAAPDWDKSLYKGFSVGLAWREFFYPFEFIDQYDAGAAAINCARVSAPTKRSSLARRNSTRKRSTDSSPMTGSTTPPAAAPRTRSVRPNQKMSSAVRVS